MCVFESKHTEFTFSIEINANFIPLQMCTIQNEHIKVTFKTKISDKFAKVHHMSEVQ